MTDGDKRLQTFKITVTQEYDVYLCYSEGIEADTEDEVITIVFDDAIEAAFNEDGLIAKTHDESATGNGYIGHVTTFDPKVNLVYNTTEMPNVIKIALIEKGLVRG